MQRVPPYTLDADEMEQSDWPVPSSMSRRKINPEFVLNK
jgi:hypothetical protein